LQGNFRALIVCTVCCYSRLKKIVVQNWYRYLKFRCTGCGNCCRDTIVCVTDEDLRRIADATGKSPAQFVRFYKPNEVSMSQEDSLWIKFGFNTAVMGLRSRDDHCMFLDSKTNFCTIYEHRPVACRNYPFKVTVSDTGAVEKISLRRAVKCLHAWDGNNSRRSLRAIHSWNQRQEKGYVKKIKAWNRQRSESRSRAAFLRFLGFTV
jgi:Fe-S-cluster containining protein